MFRDAALIIIHLHNVCLSIPSLEVVYDWSEEATIPIAWPNATWASRHATKKVSVIGIKVWRDNLLLTLPRWYGNQHPLNLAIVELPGNKASPSAPLLKPKLPKLKPFPSWEVQKLGDCSAIQFVQSMQVEEEEEVVWLPDNGREFRSRRRKTCSPKLLLLSLKTNTILHQHEFPSNIVPRSGSFLNDIAINIADKDGQGKFAYISDSDRGVLVVFSLAQDRSWTVEHSSMRADLRGASFSFINPPARLRISDNHINGLALSPPLQGSKHLYYSPLTGLKLWKVDTQGLNGEGQQLVVKEIGDKRSQTDGLVIDPDGRLFMQELTENALRMWDTNRPWSEAQTLVQDNTTLIWPDSLAIGEGGRELWATTRGWPLDSQPRVVRLRLDRAIGRQ